jgi:hypothetical protein
MFALVATYHGAPERTDEVIRLARRGLLPGPYQLDGCEGASCLVDRQCGKAIFPEHPKGEIPRTSPGPEEQVTDGLDLVADIPL